MTAIYFQCTWYLRPHTKCVVVVVVLLLLQLLLLLSSFNQNRNAPKNFCNNFKYEIAQQSVQLESYTFRADKQKDRLTA